MISIRLKDLCNQYGVFIYFNSNSVKCRLCTHNSMTKTLLRGAKAIADKIDCGMIMLEVKSRRFTLPY